MFLLMWVGELQIVGLEFIVRVISTLILTNINIGKLLVAPMVRLFFLFLQTTRMMVIHNSLKMCQMFHLLQITSIILQDGIMESKKQVYLN